MYRRMSELRLRKIWNLDWKVSVVDRRILDLDLLILIYICISTFDENKMYKSENNIRSTVIDDNSLSPFSFENII